jgi:excinuclease UvrABC nuclease subunit
MHFGGIEALKKATIKDLASVPGIGPHHAEQIYAYLHED